MILILFFHNFIYVLCVYTGPSPSALCLPPFSTIPLSLLIYFPHLLVWALVSVTEVTQPGWNQQHCI